MANTSKAGLRRINSDLVLNKVTRIRNASMCIRGIGETMIDSGIREASEGMGEPLSPPILGELEAGLIALSEFIDDELDWLEGKCQEAKEVQS